MEGVFHSVSGALSLPPREHLALVGAGGKTSAMLELARELRKQGKKVAATTTTKVGVEEARALGRLILLEEEGLWESALRRCLEEEGSVFIGQGLNSEEKVMGVPAVMADEIFSYCPYVITEADGAAKRPLKVPEEHEPVIPASSTHVVGFMGCEALGGLVGPEVVFRLERFIEMTALVSGARISADTLLEVFNNPRGIFKGAPKAARKSAFLNKTDIALDYQECLRLAENLACNSSFLDRVVAGSILQGRFLVLKR